MVHRPVGRAYHGSMPLPEVVTFVLGKPPERSPVLPDVIAQLQRQHVRAEVVVPGSAQKLELPHSTQVVAIRGVAAPVLVGLVPHEDGDVRWVNAPSAMLRIIDRAALHADLAGAGLPVPHQERAASWEQVAALAAGGPSVVKAVDSTVGRGRHVLMIPDGVAPTEAPFPGPYVVSELIATDGVDRKLYVIGDRVAGLAKPWPRPESGDGTQPLDVTDELVALARGAADAAGLTVCGVDVLAGPAGPAIVDVNAFPSCKGVPGAAESIARHLVSVM